MKKFICICICFVLSLIACVGEQPIPMLNEPSFCKIEWVKMSEMAGTEITSIPCTCDIGCEEYWQGDYYHKDPAFNPNDPRQMAYIKGKTNERECNREIRIFDFCTGQDRFVSHGACGFLSWSTKDWILFTGTNNQVWKVKTNGDSLTQLTNEGLFNNQPIWNPGGDKFLFSRTSRSQRYAILSDGEGKILDTLEQLNHLGVMEWPKEDMIIGLAGSSPLAGPFLYTPSSNMLEIIDELDVSYTNDSVVMDVAYLPSEHTILWQTLAVIAKTNIDTKKRTLLNTGGGLGKSKDYWGMALSPDESFIITQRRNRSTQNSCLYYVDQRLHVMDPDGRNERRLLIPE